MDYEVIGHETYERVEKRIFHSSI